MTENENETVEVDGDHPWVQAAAIMEPQPVRTHIGLFPSEIEIETENGTKVADAAMLNVITPVGVTAVYLPPAAVIALFQQCQAVLQFWEQQAAMSQKLVVATPDMEREAKKRADSLNEAAKAFRND